MSTIAGNPVTSANGYNTPTPTPTATSSNMSMSSSDFMQMMVTELQNQDPTQPTSSDQLLTQISEIGSLQSSTQLQSTLTSMGLQSAVGSGSAMIGNTVTGINDLNKPVSGKVDSVSVQSGNVYLMLDSGSSLQMSNVSTVTPPAKTAATTTTGATTAAS